MDRALEGADWLALGPNDLPASRDRFTCVMYAVCVARGSRAAVCGPRGARGTRPVARGMARSAHTARGSVFGARGQNLDCVDVVRTLIA